MADKRWSLALLREGAICWLLGEQNNSAIAPNLIHHSPTAWNCISQPPTFMKRAPGILCAASATDAPYPKLNIQHSPTVFWAKHAFSQGNIGNLRADLKLNIQNGFIILFLYRLFRAASSRCSAPVIRPTDRLTALKCLAFFYVVANSKNLHNRAALESLSAAWFPHMLSILPVSVDSKNWRPCRHNLHNDWNIHCKVSFSLFLVCLYW